MSINTKSAKKTVLSGLMASSLFGLASTKQVFMYFILVLSVVLSIKLLSKTELVKFVHEMVISTFLTLLFQIYQTPEPDPIVFAIQIVSAKLLLVVLYIWEIVHILKRPP